MQLKHLFIRRQASFEPNSPLIARGEFLVPGLGEIHIENVLSAETLARVEHEAVLNARSKFGLQLTAAAGPDPKRPTANPEPITAA